MDSRPASTVDGNYNNAMDITTKGTTDKVKGGAADNGHGGAEVV